MPGNGSANRSELDDVALGGGELAALDAATDAELAGAESVGAPIGESAEFAESCAVGVDFVVHALSTPTLSTATAAAERNRRVDGTFLAPLTTWQAR